MWGDTSSKKINISTFMKTTFSWNVRVILSDEDLKVILKKKIMIWNKPQGIEELQSVIFFFFYVRRKNITWLLQQLWSPQASMYVYAFLCLSSGCGNPEMPWREVNAPRCNLQPVKDGNCWISLCGKIPRFILPQF